MNKNISDKSSLFSYLWKTYLKVTSILIIVLLIVLWKGGLVEDAGLKTVIYISIIFGSLISVLITMFLNKVR